MGCNNSKKQVVTKQSIMDRTLLQEISKIESDNTSLEKFIPDLKYGKVIKVYDGDTITALCPVLNSNNKQIYKFSIRIRGIDCPELRTTNVTEKEISQKARRFVNERLMHKLVRFTNVSFDKYGRILCNVFINNINISTQLCEQRLAVSYLGGTKKSPKCWKRFHETGEFN